MSYRDAVRASVAEAMKRYRHRKSKRAKKRRATGRGQHKS
jgi:hypothetical protein